MVESTLSIPPRLRRAFRERATGYTLREIDGFWQDEGFVPGEADDVQGERRSLWLKYEAAVDWTYEAHILRVLRVYENLVPRSAGAERDEIDTLLQREGFELDGRGASRHKRRRSLLPQAIHCSEVDISLILSRSVWVASDTYSSQPTRWRASGTQNA